MKKFFYIFILALIFLGIGFFLFCIRLFSPEDSWICNNGNWIKHGNPSEPMPTRECK